MFKETLHLSKLGNSSQFDYFAFKTAEDDYEFRGGVFRPECGIISASHLVFGHYSIQKFLFDALNGTGLERRAILKKQCFNLS